jgi:hypothetical protein
MELLRAIDYHVFKILKEKEFLSIGTLKRGPNEDDEFLPGQGKYEHMATSGTTQGSTSGTTSGATSGTTQEEKTIHPYRIKIGDLYLEKKGGINDDNGWNDHICYSLVRKDRKDFGLRFSYNYEKHKPLLNVQVITLNIPYAEKFMSSHRDFPNSMDIVNYIATIMLGSSLKISPAVKYKIVVYSHCGINLPNVKVVNGWDFESVESCEFAILVQLGYWKNFYFSSIQDDEKKIYNASEKLVEIAKKKFEPREDAFHVKNQKNTLFEFLKKAKSWIMVTFNYDYKDSLTNLIEEIQNE